MVKLQNNRNCMISPIVFHCTDQPRVEIISLCPLAPYCMSRNCCLLTHFPTDVPSYMRPLLN